MNEKDTKDTFVWKQGIMIKPGETATIKLIENGKVVDKSDDIDILGVDTPFGFEIRGIKRKN